MGPLRPGAADADLATIERALGRLLRLHTSRKVHTRRATAAGVAISQPGLLLLRRLEQTGPLATGELARLAQMDPAAAGRQVRQLEDEGLVNRARDPEDGRVSVVSATARGVAVSRRFGDLGDRHLADVLAGWSDQDRRRFATLLPRFVDGLREVPFRRGDEELAS